MLRVCGGGSTVLALPPLRPTGPSQNMARKEGVLVVVAVSLGGGQAPASLGRGWGLWASGRQGLARLEGGDAQQYRGLTCQEERDGVGG